MKIEEKIKVKIKELEEEIERLKLIESIEISDEDESIMTFFGNKYKDIEYFCYTLHQYSYNIAFYDSKSKIVCFISFDKKCTSIVPEGININIDLILENEKE